MFRSCRCDPPVILQPPLPCGGRSENHQIEEGQITKNPASNPPDLPSVPPHRLAEQADTAAAVHTVRRDGASAESGGGEGALRAAAPVAGILRRGNPQGVPPVRANLPP